MEDKFRALPAFPLLIPHTNSTFFRYFFDMSGRFLAEFFGVCSGKPPFCSGTLRETFGKTLLFFGKSLENVLGFFDAGRMNSKALQTKTRSRTERTCRLSSICLTPFFSQSSSQSAQSLNTRSYCILYTHY